MAIKPVIIVAGWEVDRQTFKRTVTNAMADLRGHGPKSKRVDEQYNKYAAFLPKADKVFNAEELRTLMKQFDTLRSGFKSWTR